MAEKPKITVEIEGNHRFELDPEVETDPFALFKESCVVERREGEAFTLWPASRVTAVYVGDVPKRQVGFPTVPRG